MLLSASCQWLFIICVGQVIYFVLSAQVVHVYELNNVLCNLRYTNPQGSKAFCFKKTMAKTAVGGLPFCLSVLSGVCMHMCCDCLLLHVHMRVHMYVDAQMCWVYHCVLVHVHM